MWIPLLSLIARLGLAAVWLISGWIKFVDPSQTVVAVRAYQLLPEVLVRPVAAGLPIFELVLGLLLLIGLAVRAAAVVGAAALLTLIVVIASVWARGLSIDCGCFGGGGAADVDGWDYAGEIARDLGFLALAAWLTVFPRSPLALGPGSRVRLSARTQPAMAE
ncbi:MauE/DoxX family redox-associated membrane protein [Rhodococcus sp. GXMU-t2271]|uniref:MauE/DoxX family redox-associated membrane protein n=1 Tax=Rhodococcus indonesiensis TaxID=3055869 RepID=A0ABT7RI22_9NOCA|nr:MauE/DoxX family redox-associated membrane protein [Rhodococcus indonesiensis]MDM7487292.1 MauE/DoxX family redox-associated membrane protein [Rhodococcus indonesiensis]